MCHATCAEWGLAMQPDGHWDGGKEYKFEIDGISDSGNVTEPNSHKQCGGLLVFLNKAPIAHKSKMQTSASLSMAEGELIAACEVAQFNVCVGGHWASCKEAHDPAGGLQRCIRSYLWLEYKQLNKACLHESMFPV